MEAADRTNQHQTGLIVTRACAGALLPGERASFTLPLGACDTHVHLLGPYSRFPLSENRSYTAPEATADDLIALQESLGLQRAVIVNATAYGADSGVMLAALRAYPHRLRGVAVLEPDTTDAELDRLSRIGRFITAIRSLFPPLLPP